VTVVENGRCRVFRGSGMIDAVYGNGLEKAVYIRYVTFRKVCYLGIVLEK
jgi:hypothetical protein